MKDEFKELKPVYETLDDLDSNIIEDDIHKLEEMSEVGRKNNIIIKVFAREGNIPHFHIITTQGKSTCLQFKKNAYFLHGKYTDTLNNKDLKTVIDILNYKRTELNGLTNWQLAIIGWNMNNPDKNKQLPLDLKMPSYKSPVIEKDV